MYHEIPSPEQAAELAAWWRQAFEALEALEPRRVSEGFRSRLVGYVVPPMCGGGRATRLQADVDDKEVSVMSDFETQQHEGETSEPEMRLAIRNYVRFVALGDSASCGVGNGNC